MYQWKEHDCEVFTNGHRKFRFFGTFFKLQVSLPEPYITHPL